jgi:hypothetical protein
MLSLNLNNPQVIWYDTIFLFVFDGDVHDFSDGLQHKACQYR